MKKNLDLEEVYLKSYPFVLDVITNLDAYFSFYNHKRLHQSLNYQPPAIVHFN
jgi:putative transposase